MIRLPAATYVWANLSPPSSLRSGRARAPPSAWCAVSLSHFLLSPVKVSHCRPKGAGLMTERG